MTKAPVTVPTTPKEWRVYVNSLNQSGKREIAVFQQQMRMDEEVNVSGLVLVIFKVPFITNLLQSKSRPPHWTKNLVSYNNLHGILCMGHYFNTYDNCRFLCILNLILLPWTRKVVSRTRTAAFWSRSQRSACRGTAMKMRLQHFTVYLKLRPGTGQPGPCWSSICWVSMFPIFAWISLRGCGFGKCLCTQGTGSEDGFLSKSPEIDYSRSV